jgi:nucleoside-diphosphate-sugar epimerase
MRPVMQRQTLLVFGLGYTGAAIARAAAEAGYQVTVTTRSVGSLASAQNLRVTSFDAADEAVAAATHIVSTVPPAGDGLDAGDAADPVLHRYAAGLAGAPDLRWIGYLSTTGVYGDRNGGWVDETSDPAPGQERSRRRRRAEQAWAALAGRYAVELFRTAGIYGPDRSALDDVRAGRAKRVHRPGHAFGRIHRDDIAGAVLAAASQRRPPGVRVLHLADDEPAEPATVVAEAARLLGVAPPPSTPFDPAAMSPMARSFWAENRRVSSRLTQQWLQRRWLYPSFREGLRAILAEQVAHDTA